MNPTKTISRHKVQNPDVDVQRKIAKSYMNMIQLRNQ